MPELNALVCVYLGWDWRPVQVRDGGEVFIRRNGRRNESSCKQSRCFWMGNLQCMIFITYTCIYIYRYIYIYIYREGERERCFRVWNLIILHLTTQLWRINETTFNLRVFNKQFVGLDKGGNGVDIVAVAASPGRTETFQIQRNPDDLNRVRIRAPNGFFLQVNYHIFHLIYLIILDDFNVR